MMRHIVIGTRPIGPEQPTYVIAEMSANHNHSFEQAMKLVQAAKEAGADAIKLQTYTADTLTIDCSASYFQIGIGTIWEGENLHKLYSEAYTPWEWQPKLKDYAESLGLDLFSTPFDSSSVEFLERMNVPAYKIASFELVDTALLRQVARTGRPIIMSTGMATLAEIDEAVSTLRDAGATQIALLKCTSAYPAPPDEMNLRTIPHLGQAFGVPVGLSDHTLGVAAAIAAVTLGACIVEKHFTLCRAIAGPDSHFSLEPHEFAQMVGAIREVERAVGEVRYQVTASQAASRMFRRSLFVVEDIKAGELFTSQNVRSIRPGHGLAPKHFEDIIGRSAAQHVSRGTPLDWTHVAGVKR